MTEDEFTPETTVTDLRATIARLRRERDEARAIVAEEIRRELVCCDVYERDHGTVRAGRVHAICFWGEAAARIVLAAPSEKDEIDTTEAEFDAMYGQGEPVILIGEAGDGNE